MSSHLIIIAVVCTSTCATTELRIWDGDTMWVGDRKIRMVGYDTPERGHRAECNREAELAEDARERLAEILTIADRIELGETIGRSYDRELAQLTVNGVDVGEMLIEEGFATHGRDRSNPWC